MSSDRRRMLSAVESARLAGLRYVNEQTPGIRRRGAGRGVTFADAGGRRVRDAETLRRIWALVIPPRDRRLDLSVAQRASPGGRP